MLLRYGLRCRNPGARDARRSRSPGRNPFEPVDAPAGISEVRTTGDWPCGRGAQAAPCKAASTCGC